MAAGVVTFGLWRFGAWTGSLFTQRTPLYFAFHGWASAIVSPLVGVLVAVVFGQDEPLW